MKKDIDMCSGPIALPLFKFALPIIFSGLLQLLYNAADIIVVGNFAENGSQALAAVSSTGSITNLLVNLFLGLSVGAAVTIAHCYGARDDRGVFETLHTAAMIAIISGAIVGVGGFFAARPILQLMNSPADVIDLSTLYLKIIFIGMPANMVYNFFSGILRSTGDSRRPLFILAGSGLVNVILNLVFVICFNMSVAGVALATIISQYLSAILVTVCLMRSTNSCKLHLGEIKIYGERAKKILQIGIPSGIQSCMFSLSNVLIQSSINSFGTLAVAGNGAAGSVEGFVYIAMNSVAQATMTFTGQNIGARRYDRLGRINLCGLTVVFLVGVSTSLLVNLFATPLLSLYNSDPATIAYGIERMRWVCVPYFLCGMMEVLSSQLRGMGCSFTAMIISLLGVCGLRIVWIYTVFAAFNTLWSLYLSYAVSWAFVIIANSIALAVIRRRLMKQAQAEQPA